MDINHNELFKASQNTLVPASNKKGIINQFYPESWTADVQIIGSVQTVLKGIPVSLAVSASDIKAGDRCRVDMFDETNPRDSVVAYTYGRAKYKKTNSGFFSHTTGTNVSVPHGLGIKPDFYCVSPQDSGGTVIYISQVADATNIYVTIPAASANVSFFWFAGVQ